MFASPGLTPQERRQVARDIAAGMYGIHAARVVHADLKPANVLLAADGTAKVCDFGISQVLRDCSPTFSTGGTQAYMAPECKRALAFVTMKADVFSYGVVLSQLLVPVSDVQGL